jgi:hypothetical protein
LAVLMLVVVLLSTLEFTTIAEATSGKVDMEAHNAIRMDESVEGFFMTDDDGRGSHFPNGEG